MFIKYCQVLLFTLCLTHNKPFYYSTDRQSLIFLMYFIFGSIQILESSLLFGRKLMALTEKGNTAKQNVNILSCFSLYLTLLLKRSFL